MSIYGKVPVRDLRNVERRERSLMGLTSIWHWLVILLVVVVLFGGKGKISSLMGDFGKGLRNFKKSIKEDDGDQGSDGESAKTLSSEQPASVQPKADEAQKS